LLFSITVVAIWILSYTWKFEIYPGYEFRPWRLLLLTYAVPGVLAFLWVLRLPESPRYLLTMKRDDEALEIVKWIYMRNKGEIDTSRIEFEGLKPEANSDLSGKSVKGM
jgi:hypothetical protein